MTARRSRENVRNARGMYVDGNTVRRLQEVPERNIPAVRGTQDRRQRKTTKASSAKTARRAHAVSRETMRNRQKAMSMGRGFVFFLAVISVAVLFCCVNYLQLRADITVLESELSELREENNAYESQVNSSVDLNRIKKIAIGRLGMNYPGEEQKKTYSMSNNSYVRQYQDVPDK